MFPFVWAGMTYLIHINSKISWPTVPTNYAFEIVLGLYAAMALTIIGRAYVFCLFEVKRDA